jgi:hypothetical protein
VIKRSGREADQSSPVPSLRMSELYGQFYLYNFLYVLVVLLRLFKIKFTQLAIFVNAGVSVSLFFKIKMTF